MSRNESQLLEFFSSPLSDEVVKLARPLKECFGVGVVGYSHISEDGQFYQISDDPDLTTSYFSEGYHMSNPLFKHPKFFPHDIFFESSDIYDSDYQTTQGEFSKITNQCKIYCITRRFKSSVSIFHFSFTGKETSLSKSFLNQRCALDHFCDYFVENWAKNGSRMYKYSLNAQEMFCDAFTEQHLPIVEQTVGRERIFDFAVSIGLLSKPLELTRREMECAYLLMQGKTAREVGEGLFISRRTVEQHLDSIKGKLGCAKKSEVIEKLGVYSSLNLL